MRALSVHSSALDEVGDRDAPKGSRPWAVWAVGQTLLVRAQLDSDASSLSNMLARLRDHAAHTALGFPSLEALCAAKLKLAADDVAAVLSARRGHTIRQVLGAVGRPKKGDEGNVGNSNISASGTTTPYLAARLRRDHPDAIFDETVRGSVRKAAIAAGIVKVPTGLDRLRRAWERASEEERSAFLATINQR